MNELYYGDNLDVLRRKVPSESVDLCYIDPPFNSKRNYFQIYNNQGSEDRAQAQAFVDTWTWEDEAGEGLDYILDIERLHGSADATKWTEQTVELIRGLEKVLGRGSLLAYLVHMTLRIVEIHRVLKPTGSFYLHCDPTASHYLKLVLDAVFCGQGGDYLNEIIWKRTHAHGSSKRFGPVHDVILLYSKSSNFTWSNAQVEQSEDYHKKHFRNYDEERKEHFAPITLTGSGTRNGESGKPWRGTDPTKVGRHWALPGSVMASLEINGGTVQERLDRLDAAGRVYWPKAEDGTPRLKWYVSDAPAKAASDLWTDIPPISAHAQERLGYPTQKPEALLERIIKASSNEGDTVLDAYCGCGTTVAVAQRLNRRWIGIDVTYQSIALILKRFQDTYEKSGDWPAVEANIKLDGVPRDLESAMALANRNDDKTRKEFEKWAILTYSRNQARINEKKGADGGVDGVVYFIASSMEDDQGFGHRSQGKAIFQVKSRPGTRSDLATLNSDRLREKAEIGFLICTALPTKPMRDEIAAAGKFRHPTMNREDDRLQVVTVAEMFPGPSRAPARLDLPMARVDAVKSAAAKGDEDKQGVML